MKKRHLAGIIIAILILITALYFIERSFGFNITKIENYISSFGPWVPILLLMIIIITSSIGFIFNIPVAITALLLNSYLALFISILGLTIGASISFFLARYFARGYFKKHFINKINILEEYDKKIGENSFLKILFLRLIALIPYELINIAAGLSQIRFLPFISATFIGVIPGAILTIYLIKNTQNVFSLQFLFASILMTLFFVLPLLSRKLRKIVFNL